jgi:polysaccharide chain length determinant protein (PEP-CTERM system associated)
MKQQVLSRSRLQHIIEQFKLYDAVAKRLGAEGAVDQMRKDIKIEPVESPNKPHGEFTAFRISYYAPNAHLAQLVNTQITSLFINENIEEQSQKSIQNNEFINSELEEAGNKLKVQEEKIKEFKSQHMGDLPEQVESNVQILNGLHDQQRNLGEALNHAQEQKLFLQSQHNQLQAVHSFNPSNTVNLPQVETELARLKTALADALSKYTEQHPEVIHLKAQIARLEKQKADLEASLAADIKNNKEVMPTTPAEVQQQEALRQNEASMKANDKEIDDLHRRMQDVEAQIAAYNGRLNATPMREQQLADLKRDYDSSKANYDALYKSQQKVQLSTNLEKRQEGQRFTIVDPPILPRKPYSPDRVKFSLVGLLAGLLLGGACLGMAEYLDDSVRSRQDAKIAGVRVLVGIPHLTTPAEEQRMARRLKVEWCTAIVILGMIIAGNVLVFYKG